jgi:hypothetical protein
MKPTKAFTEARQIRATYNLPYEQAEPGVIVVEMSLQPPPTAPHPDFTRYYTATQAHPLDLLLMPVFLQTARRMRNTGYAYATIARIGDIDEYGISDRPHEKAPINPNDISQILRFGKIESVYKLASSLMGTRNPPPATIKPPYGGLAMDPLEAARSVSLKYRDARY